ERGDKRSVEGALLRGVRSQKPAQQATRPPHRRPEARIGHRGDSAFREQAPRPGQGLIRSSQGCRGELKRLGSERRSFLTQVVVPLTDERGGSVGRMVIADVPPAALSARARLL